MEERPGVGVGQIPDGIPERDLGNRGTLEVTTKKSSESVMVEWFRNTDELVSREGRWWSAKYWIVRRTKRSTEFTKNEEDLYEDKYVTQGTNKT